MFIKLLVSLTTNDIFVWFLKKKDLSAFKTQSSNNIMHKITISQKKLFVNLYKEKNVYLYIYFCISRNSSYFT